MCGAVGGCNVNQAQVFSGANANIVNQALEQAEAGDLKGAIETINTSDLTQPEKDQAIKDLLSALITNNGGAKGGTQGGGGCGGGGSSGGASGAQGGGGCGGGSGAGGSSGSSFFSALKDLIEALKSGDPKKIEEAKKNLKAELTGSGLTGEQADSVISSVESTTSSGTSDLSATTRLAA